MWRRQGLAREAQFGKDPDTAESYQVGVAPHAAVGLPLAAMPAALCQAELTSQYRPDSITSKADSKAPRLTSEGASLAAVADG